MEQLVSRRLMLKPIKCNFHFDLFVYFMFYSMYANPTLCFPLYMTPFYKDNKVRGNEINKHGNGLLPGD